jgi:signal transduction histidine kinase
LARIQTMVDQASGVVRAMVGFGRAASGNREPCDPGEVVDETLRLLGDRWRRDVRVCREVEADLPRVWASRDLLQQMLLNLMLNAAEAVEPGGVIRVRAWRMSAMPAEVVLAAGPATAYVGLSVEDNGCGIAPDVLPRLFEPFFTTKALSSRRGAGLGLYMVYESAKEMGHGLSVISAVGQGSTFAIILPVVETAGGRDVAENH